MEGMRDGVSAAGKRLTCHSVLLTVLLFVSHLSNYVDVLFINFFNKGIQHLLENIIIGIFNR